MTAAATIASCMFLANARALDFPATQTYPAGDGPYQVSIADFNADQVADFAVVNTGFYPSGTGSISVYLGNGDGTFQSQVVYPVGVFPQGIATGDLNEDGSDDIVAVNRFPNGQGPFYLSVLLSKGDGTGTFAYGPQIPTGYQAMHAAIADLNGDGHLDMAVAVHGDSVVQILLGCGDGTFYEPFPRIPVGSGVNGIVIVDVNGDGVPDVITSNWWGYNLSVLLGHGDGTFHELLPRPLIGHRAWSLDVGDFNRDGRVDVVVPNSIDRTISTLLGNADGTFQPQKITDIGFASYDVTVADLDADGKLDLVTGQYLTGVSVFRGNGDGTWVSPSLVYPPASFPSVGIGDLDGDGDLDLVATDYETDSVIVFLQNQPPITRCSSVTVAAGPDCTAEASIDDDSFDPDSSDTITLTQSPPGPYPLGDTLVTLTVVDNHGASSSCEATVTVLDTAAPSLSPIPSVTVLWPPNHMLQPVSIQANAFDNCTQPVHLEVTVESNEPPGAQGSGNTAPDFYIDSVNDETGLIELRLRAERAGTGDDRIYTIVITAVDGSGNESTGAVEILAPHDKGKK